ncbi:MAG: penicillin acylase family protein [Pseudomonadales bacterium]|jgi:penicillin amidase|nr:penicillin acylase family protein [Pseudomonadales bacterium]
MTNDPYQRITARIPTLSSPVDLYWDRWGIPHVFGKTVADAFAGLGYAAGFERLWQIELSRLYATGTVASVLGSRFLKQDAVMRTFNIPASPAGVPASPGDYIVDAYLSGLNSYIDQLDEVPPEFRHAGTEPRHFSRDDVAARYRFSCWFQHRSWLEKILMARLMAEHGVARWKHHLNRFSASDEKLFESLKEIYQTLNVDIAGLIFPDFPAAAQAGSNNWAVAGLNSQSGKPMLASDPHQPFSLPNVYFLSHLQTPDFDLTGASFPGMPFFPIGHTRHTAWGITTGFIDNYDVYIEEIQPDDQLRYRTPEGTQELQLREEIIRVKGEEDFVLPIQQSRHGPLFEPLMESLGLAEKSSSDYRTALRWSIGETPTSAGTLARLPLARTAAEFGEFLFEEGKTPLVFNLICVDASSNMNRWIATVIPKRMGVTGVLPLPGWDSGFDWQDADPEELLVQKSPDDGIMATANHDTMVGISYFPIHNYPASNDRYTRIRELLEEKKKISIRDMQEMQLDLLDIRARRQVPPIVELLSHSKDEDVITAISLLANWDYVALPESVACSVFYLLLAKRWHEQFLTEALKREKHDSKLVRYLAYAPGIQKFSVDDFLSDTSPWQDHRQLLTEILEKNLKAVVQWLAQHLGSDPSDWQWQRIHAVAFSHTLQQQASWSHMKLGPDPIGGTPTTLSMAGQLGEGPFEVVHGPVLRMLVDLGDPDHTLFVMAGGNSGRHDSVHATDQYALWLSGEYFTIRHQKPSLGQLTDIRWQITS